MAILLAKQIAELFLMIFLGYLIVKAGLLKAEDSRVLSIIALYLIGPGAVINSFQIQYSADVQKGLILAFATGLLIHVIYTVITWIAGKIFHFNGVEKASVMYTNCGNLIIPIVLALFGKDWIIYSSGYTVVYTMFIWSHGRMIVCEEKSISVRKILGNINVIAIAVGLAMFVLHIRLPAMVRESMDSLTVMIGPISMILAGMIIAGMDLKKVFMFKRTYLVTFMKMILYPALALLVIKLTRLELLAAEGNTILLISMLAAAAPTGATITQMAQVYDKDSEYASAIYFITTMLSIVTMPFMIWLYQMY